MKFESQILAALFVACFGVCALVMGAMLKTTPTPVQLASTSKVAAIVLVAPASCTLPTDGASCARGND
ncbi:hypothetical protein [Dyella sp. S184]|jgi:membrane protein implicated in regulation of membrane protease activity|uniref:hypothetical protein n=1 Tax=Dyella sp. S184 TaxID=1641862 RepID=UPI00131B6C26|nr:hypothetical protein [Dyella sp. S184]